MLILIPLVVVLAGAWSYRWVQEDAFINFRIIGNLLAGHGPVFNVGERVEAYTDPLWLFSVAGLHEITPFLSIEWLSVILGVIGTAGGVVLSGRAIQRLGGSRGSTLVVPLGLVVFAAVAGVWEFSTSGLEMGMVFGWMGLSFWLLVRTEQRRDSAISCAFVIGLGALIRPELLLMSIVYLGALAAVVSAKGWRGPASFGRRYLAPLGVAIALPLLYELWRMAYFALIVSNSALAKSAASSRWSQGFTYLWNFVAPYTLWLPLALALPLLVPRAWAWGRRRDWTGTVVLLTPIGAGLVDVAYVVRVGGDYQHARLLLPAFMSLCLPVYFGVKQLRSVLLIPIIGVLVWVVVCAGWLRYSTGSVLRFDHGITDERSVWQYASGSTHPIEAADYHNVIAAYYRGVASTGRARHQQLMLDYVTGLRIEPPDTKAARSVLPFHLVVSVGAIGVTGYLSGSDVYLFDELSLANPVGAHFIVTRRGRPGHEKYIGPTWMIARFGVGTALLPDGVSARSVLLARKALACAPLHSYLQAISTPLDLSQAISDVAHSLTYTTMQFSSNPHLAEQQLCR